MEDDNIELLLGHNGESGNHCLQETLTTTSVKVDEYVILLSLKHEVEQELSEDLLIIFGLEGSLCLDCINQFIKLFNL